MLGHNGAGKTTTMKIITAEEAPTHGRVRLYFYYEILLVRELRVIFGFRYKLTVMISLLISLALSKRWVTAHNTMLCGETSPFGSIWRHTQLFAASFRLTFQGNYISLPCADGDFISN